MGSTTTWNVFEFDLAYFRAFIPISGTSWILEHMAEEALDDATAGLMRQSVIDQGYTKDDSFLTSLACFLNMFNVESAPTVSSCF